jgi:hypothetical protein
MTLCRSMHGNWEVNLQHVQIITWAFSSTISPFQYWISKFCSSFIDIVQSFMLQGAVFFFLLTIYGQLYRFHFFKLCTTCCPDKFQILYFLSRLCIQMSLTRIYKATAWFWNHELLAWLNHMNFFLQMVKFASSCNDQGEAASEVVDSCLRYILMWKSRHLFVELT